MKIVLALALAVLVAVFWVSCRPSKNLPVVNVDLKKYQGRWYEIASIPLRFSRNCACTFAEYTADEHGNVRVYNQCLNTKTNSIDSIRGKAFPVKNSGNGKLRVQFFWPFRGDYYIIDLDSNYQYAMVGSPNRNTLWILCRERSMNEVTYQNLLQKAIGLGFDVNRLRKTRQDCP
jgi:apolipoprotein D and lipocalin family protein